jgi:hypothetical protein
VEKHEIETINDLLEYNGYPQAWIQGHHTRIIKDDNKNFIVFGKEKEKYTLKLYSGNNETQAVWVFIEFEEQ